MSKATLKLHAVPVTIKAAQRLVKEWHRHAPIIQGGLFAVAVAIDGTDEPCGVAIVGRPIARMMQDGFTCEVTRLATDGTPNACSKLYGLARSIAFKMGYKKITTTTLKTEPGTSLFAAGMLDPVECGGGTWDRPNRRRIDKHDTGRKKRWTERKP